VLMARWDGSFVLSPDEAQNRSAFAGSALRQPLTDG